MRSFLKKGAIICFSVTSVLALASCGEPNEPLTYYITETDAVEISSILNTLKLDVENEEGLLLPGMTAYVSITIDSVKNALRIPNTALRFKATKYIKTLLNMPEVSQEEKNYRARMIKDGKHVVLYVVRNGKPESILVEKGLSDLTYTEIKTDKLKEGDIILSSCLVEPQKKSKK